MDKRLALSALLNADKILKSVLPSKCLVIDMEAITPERLDEFFHEIWTKVDDARLYINIAFNELVDDK